ncbi:helicase-related protein [Selenomonas ruminantium]|uniref:defense against restriction DarA-related protein n=1 Tax=Selenomonas ruminantium TaxID=971 RepID=UPI0026F1F85D|nr:helicase-related protein [Selenomonas ruminantium]
MINYNSLLIEAHRLPREMQRDTAIFTSFLDTMAKFHRYDVTAQINLHYHAPAGARALARADIWHRSFGSALVEGATPIPVLLPNPNSKSGYAIAAVYDVQDTVAFQVGDSSLVNTPWQYNAEVNEQSAKEAIGEASAPTIEVAVHDAVQKRVAMLDTDYPSLTAASVEYIVRSRLGLSKNNEIIDSISREGVNMEVFLAQTNSTAKEILDSIGHAVRKDRENVVEEVAINEEEIPVPVIDLEAKAEPTAEFILEDDLEPSQAEVLVRERLRELSEDEAISADDKRNGFYALIDSVQYYGKFTKETADAFTHEAYLGIANTFSPVVDAEPPVRAELPEEANEVENSFNMESSLSDWFAANYPDFENPVEEGVTFQEVLTGLQDGSLDVNTIGLDNEMVRNAFFDELSELSGTSRDELFASYMGTSLVQTLEEDHAIEEELGSPSVEVAPPSELASLWMERFRTKNISSISEEIGWGLSNDDLIALAEIHESNSNGEGQYNLAFKVEDLLEDCNFRTFNGYLQSRDYAGAKEYVDSRRLEAEVTEVTESVPEADTERYKFWLERVHRHAFEAVMDFQNGNLVIDENDLIAIGQIHKTREQLQKDVEYLLRMTRFNNYADLLNAGDYEGFNTLVDEQGVKETFVYEDLNTPPVEEKPVSKLPEDFVQGLARFNLTDYTIEVKQDIEKKYPPFEMVRVPVTFAKREKFHAEFCISYEEGKGYHVAGNFDKKFGDYRGFGSYPFFTPNDTTFNTIEEAILAQSASAINTIPEMERPFIRLGLYTAPASQIVEETAAEASAMETPVMDNLFAAVEEEGVTQSVQDDVASIEIPLEQAPVEEQASAGLAETDSAVSTDIPGALPDVDDAIQEKTDELSREVLAAYPVLEFTSSQGRESSFKIPSNVDSACDVIVNISYNPEMGRYAGSTHFAFADYNTNIPMVNIPENVGPFKSIHEVLNANVHHLQEIMDGTANVVWGDDSSRDAILSALNGVSFDTLLEQIQANMAQEPVQVEQVDSIQNTSEQAARVREYKYYMNQRPIGPGTTPSDFSRFDENDSGGRYGAVYFERPLTEQEIADFELVTADEVYEEAQDNSANEDALQVSTESDMEDSADSALPDDAEAEDEAVAVEEYEDISLRPVDDSFTGIDLESLDFDATMTNQAGKKAVFLRNLAALQIVNHLEEAGTRPTELQLKVLKAYSGFGGISEVFDEHNTSWRNLYQLAKDEMTDVQYRAARASTLTAFYTPHEIIDSVYKGLENYGFDGGNILDPSTGNGRFLDDMPDSMKENSNRVGVEIDVITALIAKYANPSARIVNKPFEKSNFPDGSFDLAISNIPFNNVVVNDKEKGSRLIHDYFMNKMIDEVRPGGLVVAITSRGTMDKKNAGIREELARKAELVRAVRFPHNTFKDAGTEAVSDLLIFRKREHELSPTDELPSWTKSRLMTETDYTSRGKEIKKEYYENEYFLENPQYILGDTKVKSTSYGYDLDVIPKVRENEDGDSVDIPITELLDNALSDLPKEYVKAEQPLPVPTELPALETNVAYGYYFDKKDIIYLAPTGEKEVINVGGAGRKKLVSAMAIRDEIRSMFADEMASCDDETLINHQAKLNQLYDEHVKAYGPINKDSTLKRLFQEDSAYPLLLSLEVMEDDEVKAKSDIFSKRTIQAYSAPTHADSPEEALMISMAEKGCIDIPYMAGLTGQTGEEIIDKLEFVSIYEDIESNRYVTADEYLSGDVKEKLDFVQETKEKWEKEITDFAINELFPIPDKYIYNEKDYDKKFSLDSIGSFYFSDNLSDADIEFMFDKNNRALLLTFLNQAGSYTSKDVFNRYFDLHPENKTLFEDTEFALDILPTMLKLYSLDRLDYLDGVKVIKNVCSMANINRYKDIDAKDYAFLKSIVREYAHGEHPEVLEKENILEKYNTFSREFDDKIDQFIHDGSNETIAFLRKDIERLNKNIKALESVQPEELKAEDIKIHLGASWIPTSYIEDFVNEVFDCYDKVGIEYADITGEWKINNKKAGGTKINEIYGIEEANALVLLEKCLNHRTMDIKKTVVIDGEEKRVTDRKKTLLVSKKMQNIREEFDKWIYKDENRKNWLVDYYNRHFNNIVPRQFDGSNLTFPGMNPEIKLRDHQKDAVAHSLYGGNTLFAHVVGAGKTFEMQASAMESKRIGLCKKPLFIMPKHLTEQFGAEFLRLYPNANILVSTPKDSGKENRRNFCAKISAQDWDAIVMSYEQFEKIPLSPERLKSFIQKEIDETMEGLDQLKRMKNDSGFTVKQAEMQLKKLNEKMDAVTEEYKKHQDATIYFEQLGVDRLYVDESHNYKNLGFFTKMSGIQSQHVQKTDDLIAKIDYLNEITNERGVVFASGTPISNSFSEFFTLQKYLKPSRLESQGLKFFDLWASTFGQEVTQLELSADGKKYNPKTRFAKFDNLPELVSMFREFADVKTADMLNLDVPECEVVMEKSKPSPIQKDMVNRLVKRAELIKTGRPIVVNQEANLLDSDKGLDNMLVVINDGRNVALDTRIVDRDNPDFEDSKVNRCIANVVNEYKESESIKGTQLVFCDLSTPNASDKEKFTIYSDIVQKLQDKGIPKEEIAVIHDYEKPEQKQALFNQVNKGEVRVLLGSSDKLGIGTNVQKRLTATHDLDCPWKPSQIEQRRGRIVRHGNMNKKVKIYRYVTEGTFDAFMWQTNERKQGFIAQIMTSKTPSRSISDVDSTQMEFAEFKAACTDNPLFKEQMELTQEVEGLTVERVQYREVQNKLKPRIESELPSNIEMYKARILAAKADMKTLQENPSDMITFNGKEIKVEEAGNAFAAVCRAYKEGKIDSNKTFYGKFRGLKFEVKPELTDSLRTVYKAKFYGQSVTSFEVGLTTPDANLNRLNLLETVLENKVVSNESLLKNCERELESCKKNFGQPFPKEEEYQQKVARLAEVNALVNADKELMELDAEKEKRLNLIITPDSYEDNKPHCESYLKFAKSVLDGNDGKWPENGDETIAAKLQGEGISKEKIAEAIYLMSPACPDKDEVNAKIKEPKVACR